MIMDIYEFLWNKTKVDILKYLLFKEENVSARELESKLNQSFPAIKNQIDKLEKAWVLLKNQQWNRWSLTINKRVKPLIFNIFLFDIISFLDELLSKYYFLNKYLLWDLFIFDSSEKIWVDLVFVYNKVEEIFLDDVKSDLNQFFDTYFSDVKLYFLTNQDYEKRLKFADKFIVNLTKINQNFKIKLF